MDLRNDLAFVTNNTQHLLPYFKNHDHVIIDDNVVFDNESNEPIKTYIYSFIIIYKYIKNFEMMPSSSIMITLS